MYAVVAPGLKGIYEDPRIIDRILALYPYTKFRKFATEDECWEFIRRNENTHGLEDITDFGDAFPKHHVKMEYFIWNSNIYYNFDTHLLGTIRILDKEAVVENRANLIKVMLPNIIVDPNTISGHIIALYNGIRLLGDYIDVSVTVPDHSIFYALHSYTGNNRAITRLRRYLDSRLGKVSVTLKR